MNISEDLTPPDYERCQGNPNMLNWSPFSFSPRPRPVRCQNASDFIAVEIIAGADGKHGAMGLCLSCAEAMMESRDMRERIQLQPVLRHEPKGDGTTEWEAKECAT